MIDRPSLSRLLAGLLVCLPPLALQAEPLAPADAARLGLPSAEAADTVAWRTLYTAREETQAVEKLEAASPGGRRLLLRFTFREAPDFLLSDLRTSFNFPAENEEWLHLRLCLANFSFSGSKDEGKKGHAAVLQRGKEVWITYDAPEELSGTHTPARISFRYRSLPEQEEEALRSPVYSQLKRGTLELPPLTAPRTTLVLPAAAYRGFNDRLSTKDERVFSNPLGTAYEALENKGLKGSEIAKIRRPFHPERPVPRLIPHHKIATTEEISWSPISFSIREESGVEMPSAPLQASIPLPQGAFHRLPPLVIREASGEVLPVAVSLRAKWPDGSAKWLALHFQDTLPKAGEKHYRLEAESRPEVSTEPSIKLQQTERSLLVDTGAISVQLDKQRFLPFQSVIVRERDAEPQVLQMGTSGFELIHASGERYSTALSAPEQFIIEEQHPGMVVLRAEGTYTNAQGERSMRYVARMTFHAGSPLVQMSYTHLNSDLETEFSDFAALEWQALAPQQWTTTDSTPLSAAQWDDRASLVNGQARDERLPGGFRVVHGKGAVGLAFEHFWQRYPKAIEASAQAGLKLSLLPRQPGKDFGKELPQHLHFPYLEGLYRMKWGMATTERWTLDFSGQWSAEALATLAQKPPVAVLPAAEYAKTEVFGPFPAGKSERLAAWDRYFAELFSGHEARRERQREYGFLNYGDWFGERGRNWGNNEYDTAHAFFMQFLRTGQRDYYRSALAAARHQADVDIIHAYPDPFYVGGNYIHGIAHTGTTSHRPQHGIWSQDYGLGAWGSNGHTWAEGMTEAWLLAQDHRSAEAALSLGEHMRWAVAPNFRMNVPNPRYVGWAVRVGMAIYRTFGDTEGLKAAAMIAAKASDEQDAESGGWLYPLYGGPPGNSVYMHGILISGLAEYHRETNDASALDVMQRASEFTKRAWTANGYWPYMVTGDGKPHPQRDPAPATGLNMMIAEGLAYLGRVTGDTEALEIARKATDAQLSAEVPAATGQKVGNALRCGIVLLGYLESQEPASPPKEPQP